MTEKEKAVPGTTEQPLKEHNEGNNFSDKSQSIFDKSQTNIDPQGTNGRNVSFSPVEMVAKITSDLTKAMTPPPGLLNVKPVNTWVNEAKEQPIPSLLFSGLWYETDLCILFGDTNTGKSILAVQIADSISRGEPVPGFRFEAERQRVLYCDFELTKKQFEHRYSENYSNHYKFSPLFDRAEINPEMGLPKEFKTIEDYLMFELERIISTNGYKVLIVDNLTYLRNGTETARDALPLMKILKQLKNKYSLSILVLAHTPKRDYTKPISRNDLQGSKMLMNFCDSSFAIGESTHDKGIRYLKQIKSRFTEIMYDADNIIICQISKPDNFLGFVFTGYGSEYEHLREVSAENKEALMVQIREWKNQGLTNTEIARKVGKSEGAIRNWLKNDNKTE